VQSPAAPASMPALSRHYSPAAANAAPAAPVSSMIIGDQSRSVPSAFRAG